MVCDITVLSFSACFVTSFIYFFLVYVAWSTCLLVSSFSLKHYSFHSFLFLTCDLVPILTSAAHLFIFTDISSCLWLTMTTSSLLWKRRLFTRVRSLRRLLRLLMSDPLRYVIFPRLFPRLFIVQYTNVSVAFGSFRISPFILSSLTTQSIFRLNPVIYRLLL